MSPTVLQQAAVDEEFRAELLTNPDAYGVSTDRLPATVEQPDQEALDFWTEGVAAMEIYACATSCSWGPFTIVCDGTTK
ncbi:MAG TPA: cinnamycin family lantibiotic [Streptosporangiaceae bacterium]|nr:cinnamycin family lantibiotic [Streptosporangiaceae bacterium]